MVLPLITNDSNHFQWPQVVSQDVMRHSGEILVECYCIRLEYHISHTCITACLGGLKGDVLVVSGQVKGKTLLPLPPQAERTTMMVVDPDE